MSTSPYPQDSLQRLQAIERDIVAVIDKICRENDIEYFIDGGTCLGAVRHGGFIPWDDDVDLGMPKADYDRFCAIAPELLPAGYSLHTSTNTTGFSGLWAKVFKDGTRFIDDNALEAGCEQGAFVDIFPYCQLDADPKVAQRQCKKGSRCPAQVISQAFLAPQTASVDPTAPARRDGLQVCARHRRARLEAGGFAEYIRPRLRHEQSRTALDRCRVP